MGVGVGGKRESGEEGEREGEHVSENRGSKSVIQY